MKKFIFVFSILNLTLYFSKAQTGTLDNTFGTGGYTATQIVTNSIGFNAYAKALVIQTDGKIVTTGYVNCDNHTCYDDIVLVRYNNNGTIDNTFGVNGIVITNFGTNTDDQANAVALQNDGKIVIAGSSGNNTIDFALARYNSDGTLDNTFGTGGKVTTSFGSASALAYGMIIQPDGKIVAVGRGGISSPDFALARYNSDGSLDASFGTGGKVLTDFSNAYDDALSVALMNDGRLVVSGHSQSITGDKFALARYNSNGTLDNTFGTGGKVNTVIATPTELEARASSVLLQPDGKIVACGTVWSSFSTWERFALARYNSNGTLDNLFGNGGIDTTTFAPNAGSVCNAAVLQNDGKIILGGTANGIGLARYNTNGSLDNSFGTGGLVQNNLGYATLGYGMVLQSDGKIVVCGGREDAISLEWFFSVARFNNDNTIGIVEQDEKGGLLSIFPNPSSGIFTINVKNTIVETKICVYDLLGNCVFNKVSNKSNKQEIDLTNQLKGIYFMEIISEEQRTVKKIIVQ